MRGNGYRRRRQKTETASCIQSIIMHNPIIVYESRESCYFCNLLQAALSYKHNYPRTANRQHNHITVRSNPQDTRVSSGLVHCTTHMYSRQQEQFYTKPLLRAACLSVHMRRG